MALALIWSKMSTGLPIEITSSMESQNYTSFCRLDIDIHKNVPHIHVHEKREYKERRHDAEIQIVIEGNWTTYRGRWVQILAQKCQLNLLTPQQIVRIHQLFCQAKFDDPSGDILSPAGEYNLRLGIIKELHPDMVATFSGSAQVFEGHPFIVEVGVSVGGKDVKQVRNLPYGGIAIVKGLNVFRFANRIPLLFEQGADVVTRTAMKRINWNSYKVNQTQDKIGVFVSIVSTKIPFKGTGKEYIGDYISEIASAVKTAIQQCCNQLKSKIVKRIHAREQQERKRNLSKYIPSATAATYDLLKQTIAHA
ncbi:hypothetical protein K7X08_035833 [Anisodus acutangulus]|uniref:DNA topoisomerase VI subunit B transducer domain-containing protein n=1 Tax=Anisodus acutangulus TaxID=402998 RepID=A0A9Q1L422_9SOLA|nr:hypothetical protein K7X08_035833 [Anisodus acutangulus]